MHNHKYKVVFGYCFGMKKIKIKIFICHSYFKNTKSLSKINIEINLFYIFMNIFSTKYIYIYLLYMSILP
jgi:hypothetical protein